MRRYENDGRVYSLPLKVNLAHSKRMFGYNLVVFLFATLPSGLLIYWLIEDSIKDGFDIDGITIIVALLFMFIFSLKLIFPRHLLIDDEKIQVRCFIFSKQLYWKDAKNLSIHISDVAFTTRLNLNTHINLHAHRANQTNHGEKVGIKKVELSSLNNAGKLNTLYFNISTDANINFEMLNRTIYDAYHQ